MLSADHQIPPSLSLGQRAAETILRVLTEQRATGSGGCKLFYTPQEWIDRGETPTGGLLVIVHDGGDHARFFNHSYCAYADMETMRAALEPLGVWVEQSTSWYSVVYA